MTQAERIIGILGGDTAASRLLGWPRTTIAGWRRTGFIPARRQLEIIRVARRAGIALGPDQFIDEQPEGVAA